MKILYVIDHLGGGGAENQFVEIVSRNALLGMNVHCVLTEGEGHRKEKLILRNVPVDYIGQNNGRALLASVLRLRGLISNFQPHAVHSFLMYSGFVTAAAIKTLAKKPKFIYTDFCHTDAILEEVPFTSLKQSLAKWAIKQADLYTTDSRQVIDRMVETGYVDRSLSRFVPSGIDMDSGDRPLKGDARKELAIGDDVKMISVIASLVNRKGQHHMINAMKSVLESFHGSMLYIVGTGPEEPALKALAHRLGIADNVVFTGYRVDANLFIAASDVMVLPSRFEGMPNVVMMAMLLGTPVVATGRYGTMDLIEHEVSGMLAPWGEPDAIADMVCRVLADSEMAGEMAANARERIREFSFESVARQYCDIYMSV